MADAPSTTRVRGAAADQARPRKRPLAGKNVEKIDIVARPRQRRASGARPQQLADLHAPGSLAGSRAGSPSDPDSAQQPDRTQPVEPHTPHKLSEELSSGLQLPDGRTPSTALLATLAAAVEAATSKRWELDGRWQAYAPCNLSTRLAPCFTHPDLPGFFRSRAAVCFYAAALDSAASAAWGRMTPTSLGGLTPITRSSRARSSGTPIGDRETGRVVASALRGAGGGYVPGTPPQRRPSPSAQQHAGRDAIWARPPLQPSPPPIPPGPVLVLGMADTSAAAAAAAGPGASAARDRARLSALARLGNRRHTPHTLNRDDAAEPGRRHVQGNFNGARGAARVAAAFPGVVFSAVLLDYFRLPTGYAVETYRPGLFTHFLPGLIAAGAAAPGLPVLLPNNASLLSALVGAGAFRGAGAFGRPCSVPAAANPLYVATAAAAGHTGAYTNASESRQLVRGAEFVLLHCMGSNGTTPNGGRTLGDALGAAQAATGPRG